MVGIRSTKCCWNSEEEVITSSWGSLDKASSGSVLTLPSTNCVLEHVT